MRIKWLKHRTVQWGGGVLGAALLLFLLWPLPASFTESTLPSPTRITDRNGELLYSVRPTDSGEHVWANLEVIPDFFEQAVIATEDRSFYWHLGVSLKGTVRALWQNLTAGRVVSGGSTITQQLVRHYLNTDRRTVLYKIKEALYALKLELWTRKSTVLERYLNTAYFGHQAYGISSAADVYFGKALHELSQAEMTLLAGLPQAPSRFDPFTNFAAAKTRQETVLNSLIATGDITVAEAEALQSEQITLTDDRIEIEAPHFVMWLLDEYEDDITPGRTVRTTLDLSLQREIEDIVDLQIERLKEKNVTSAAVVVLSADSGDVVAMVGSRNYFDDSIDGQVNVATSARQPGSTLKPFTYALALEAGDNAATTIADTDIQLLTQEGNPYTPRNYDYEHHGLVRYREALANSYNIPAVKVLQKVGVGALKQLLTQAGVTTLTKSDDFYGLALTLGDGEVPLLELAQAYALFPRGGDSLHSVNVFPSEKPIGGGDRLISRETAWLISDILSDDTARYAEYGLRSHLTFDTDVAAKTGTTRNARDNWVMGYNPEYVVGVWVGNADNTPMKGTTGVTGAGPIFQDVMTAVNTRSYETEFFRPDTLTEIEICELSGMRPGEHCPYTITEWFLPGLHPREPDTMYQKVTIDTRNGLKAVGCPPEFTQEELFTVFPAELTVWALEQGYQKPPSGISPLCEGLEKKATDMQTWIQIRTPGKGDEFLLDPTVPDENEMIILTADASDIDSLTWFANSERLGTGKAPDFKLKWRPQKTGSFIIRANGGGESDQVQVRVNAP